MVNSGGTAWWVPEVLRDVDATDEDDADIYLVGVRESADPESWSLVFQEGYEDEDTYCLVIDPGQATFYGGVIECAVSDDQLYLLLSESAAEELGTPSELRFSLMLPPDQLQLLRRGLSRVLTSGQPEDVPRRLDV